MPHCIMLTEWDIQCSTRLHFFADWFNFQQNPSIITQAESNTELSMHVVAYAKNPLLHSVHDKSGPYLSKNTAP